MIIQGSANDSRVVLPIGSSTWFLGHTKDTFAQRNRPQFFPYPSIQSCPYLYFRYTLTRHYRHYGWHGSISSSSNSSVIRRYLSRWWREAVQLIKLWWHRWISIKLTLTEIYSNLCKHLHDGLIAFSPVIRLTHYPNLPQSLWFTTPFFLLHALVFPL